VAALRNRRTACAIAVVAVVILSASAFLCYRTRRYIVGTYLFQDGLYYIQITGSFPWMLKVPRQSSIMDRVMRFKALSLFGRDLRLIEARPNKTEQGAWQDFLQFEPSRSRPGDWDLLGFTRPLRRPVPYLHRVNDPNVPRYFDLQYSQPNPAGAFEIAAALLRDHPDDAYVRSLYLKAAERNNDTTEVAHRLEQWKPDFGQPDDPFLSARHRRIGRWPTAIRAGQRLADLL